MEMKKIRDNLFKRKNGEFEGKDELSLNYLIVEIEDLKDKDRLI